MRQIPRQRMPEEMGAAVAPSRLVHHIEGRNVRPKIPEIIDPFVNLAMHLDRVLDPGPEKTTALRKLLESCDAATRCRVADLENREQDKKIREVAEAVTGNPIGAT